MKAEKLLSVNYALPSITFHSHTLRTNNLAKYFFENYSKAFQVDVVLYELWLCFPDYSFCHFFFFYACATYKVSGTLSEKKGTKVVTFQKVHFCTQRMHIGTLVVHIST